MPTSWIPDGGALLEPKPTAEPRPAIPDPIKREVRQRCGFGCVICGLPLYEYDHMDDWARVQRHVAEEITLLCGRHHAEKTKGLLPVQVVRTANAQPFALRQGRSDPYRLHFFSGRDPLVVIGSLRFDWDDDAGGDMFMTPAVIDDIQLVRFDRADSRLLLSLRAFDAENQLVLDIRQNELVYSVSPWDIEFLGKTLTIREGHGQILLEIEFSPPETVHIKRGKLQLNGIEFQVDPESVLIKACWHELAGLTFRNCPAGLVAGDSPLHAAIAGFLAKPEHCVNRSGDRAADIIRQGNRLVRRGDSTHHR